MTYAVPADPIASTVKTINSVTTKEELQAEINKAFNALGGVKQGIQAELNHIAPLMALISAPTTLTAVVTWIGSFITNVLEPMVLPQATLNLHLMQLTTSVATLTTAIHEAEARIGSSVTIPTI